MATPLGNLGDLTERARTVLGRVPVVAAEDTRRTGALLRHLGASPRMWSYHRHSGEDRSEALVRILQDGADVALVTDAGTPAISDPGAHLVRQVRAAGIPVVPIPGPSAVATALSAAGIPASGDRFAFLGFLPRKGGERQRLLASVAGSEWTVVLFEAANRLVALLEDLIPLVGEGDGRRVVVARELTKLHEELREGTLAELAEHYRVHPPQGEVTVVIAGTGVAASRPDRSNEARALAERLLQEGVRRRDVAREVSRILEIPRNEAYRIVMSLP